MALGDEFLARHIAELILQLTSYGIRLEDAIHEGWRVLYGISSSEREEKHKNDFEVIESAKVNLNWALMMIKKQTGWKIDTNPQSWQVPANIAWREKK